MNANEKAIVIKELADALDAADRACAILDTNTAANLILENLYMKMEAAADKIKAMDCEPAKTEKERKDAATQSSR